MHEFLDFEKAAQPKGFDIHAPIKCLDHGFVQLIDHMGSDQSIADDARVSIAGDGVKATSDLRGLLRYLFRHRHTTPFEGVTFKFLLKMPIFVWRQIVRHRTSKFTYEYSTVDEMSARYGILPEEFYIPETADIQFQSKNNKQGRGGAMSIEATTAIQTQLGLDAHREFKQYKQYLGEEHSGDLPTLIYDELQENGGMARELARINLPLSTYTMFRWKVDLHNLFHLLGLRKDSHAQKEIRVFADALGDIVQHVVPIAYECFEDFKLWAVTFSRLDMIALSMLTNPRMLVNRAWHGWDDHWPTKREKEEFWQKLDAASVYYNGSPGQ